MAMKNGDVISKSIYYQLADVVEISAIFSHGDKLIFRARPRVDPDYARDTIRSRLEKSGFRASFSEESPGFLINVSQAGKIVVPRINIILFLLTVITVFLAPAIQSGVIFPPEILFDYLLNQGGIARGLGFMVPLMIILLCHEFGHYLSGRRRGIFMSLPYFIPAPTIFGTFGAIIRSRSPITNRRDLIEVGAAGPLAGFVVAVIVMIIGLHQSEIIPVSPEGGLKVGGSLLYIFLKWLIIGPIPDGYGLLLAPSAFAAWVGFFVTMLNLLPIGQLDGGHIVYGLFGRNQHLVARVMAAVIIGLGFMWFGWWFFGALVIFFGLNHPPTIQDDIPAGRPAGILGLLAMIIFVVTFIPVPFSIGM
jgi:hypothetical protein